MASCPLCGKAPKGCKCAKSKACSYRYPVYGALQGAYLKSYAVKGQGYDYFPCHKGAGHVGPHQVNVQVQGNMDTPIPFSTHPEVWIQPGSLRDPARWVSTDGVRARPYPDATWSELEPLVEWSYWCELLKAVRGTTTGIVMLGIGFAQEGADIDFAQEVRAGYAEVTENEGFRYWLAQPKVKEFNFAALAAPEIVAASHMWTAQEPLFLALHTKPPLLHQSDGEVACGGYQRMPYTHGQPVIFPQITFGHNVATHFSVGTATKLLWVGQIHPAVVLTAGVTAHLSLEAD